MTVQDLINFVQAVGIPAAFAFYILMRIEPTLKQLDKSIQLLTIIVAQFTGQDAKRIQDQYQPAAASSPRRAS